MNNQIRRNIVEAAYHAKHGHMPSALSIVEIICALHIVMKPEDIFILSKGHGCLAYYAYLAERGKISFDELRSFGKKGSILGGHPDKNKVPGIYASTGSLGHGLPTAVGTCLARKIQGIPGKVYCLVGDGECNEGSIWEAAMIAAHNKLTNLTCIIDDNNSQTRSLPTNSIRCKFDSFLWHTQFSQDNIQDITDCIGITAYAPLAVVVNTTKGKGIKAIENDVYAWHHRAPNEAEYKQFKEELSAYTVR